MNERARKVYREYSARFGGNPVIIRSPGRVNLIGDHTDYNDGFVLPAAINLGIYIAMAPNDDQKLRAAALDMPNPDFESDISSTLSPVKTGWANYLLGSVYQLRERGYSVPGFNCVISGDIPFGAGLSSSAALEGGILFGLNHVGGYGLSREEIAKAGQLVEHTFAGVQCGIMDQFANLFGRENKLIKLDCRSLDFEFYPFFDDEVRILLFDSKVHRELAGSEYNVRRQQCSDAMAVLAKSDPSMKSLRDVSFSQLEKHRQQMDSVVYNRARFVLDENHRVLDACVDLKYENLVSFGQRMYESHEGLSRLYEVSCKELDFLVEKSKELPGVLGARMMGGGFGGCTINLVKKENAEEVREQLLAFYKKETGIESECHVVKTADGTSITDI